MLFREVAEIHEYILLGILQFRFVFKQADNVTLNVPYRTERFFLLNASNVTLSKLK
jgi:hypothetical protein